ncbi:MAG: cell wall hydrolase [Oscillospiraceae bacterium]
MGLNKKKCILNIIVIGMLSNMIGGVVCSAEDVTNINTDTVNVNESVSIIKKLDFENGIQEKVDTYNNLKETERVQNRNKTLDLLNEVANSNKYSKEEKKAISQQTIITAIVNSVLEKEEGMKLLTELNAKIEKVSNVKSLNNTIDNILNSSISISGKDSFCKTALELAKANETITEEEFNSKMDYVQDILNNLQEQEDERIAKQLAKEEQARKEEEARIQAEKQAQELAKKQAEELARQQAEELARQQAEELARQQAEQEKINQKALEQTTDTTVDTSNLQQATYEEPEYYNGFAGTLQYTDKDFLALCNAVQHEVGNCSAQSKKMVASVIVNRALSGKFPSSMYEVITQPNQFTGISAYVNRTDYATEDTIYWCQYVLDNGVDYSNGALFYYAPQWCGYMSYFENMTLVGECDGQRYFRQ